MGAARARTGVTLTRLSLGNFRSYTDAVIAPGPGFVILTGENGAGKTNILEAISLLAPGRGLRGAALSEMARIGSDGSFGVAARLGEVDIGTGTTTTAPERRLVRINGVQAPATALSEWLSIIWITPAMDRLFMEGASERRRFLDRLVLALEPGHAVHANRYEAAMRQRNRLLSGEEAPDPDWLTALEVQMGEHGAAITSARAHLITELTARIATTTDGPFARAGLSIEGWLPGGDLAQDLMNGRVRDAAAGRTLLGPHRSDLAVMHMTKTQPAARCSTGEQKALLVGIVLAHADLVAERVARRPILLLDEVAAHLDAGRRAALFDRLAMAGGQVWLTGTEQAPFSSIGHTADWISMRNGRLE